MVTLFANIGLLALIIACATGMAMIAGEMASTKKVKRNVDTKSFPEGWSMYWDLRLFPHELSIADAQLKMIELGFSDFCAYRREDIRRLEVMTRMNQCRDFTCNNCHACKELDKYQQTMHNKKPQW